MTPEREQEIYEHDLDQLKKFPETNAFSKESAIERRERVELIEAKRVAERTIEILCADLELDSAPSLRAAQRELRAEGKIR